MDADRGGGRYRIRGLSLIAFGADSLVELPLPVSCCGGLISRCARVRNFPRASSFGPAGMISFQPNLVAAHPK